MGRLDDALRDVVAELAVRGMTNREIAAELVVSVKTVEHHLGIVFAKLGLSNRTHLAYTYRPALAVLADLA